MTLQLPPYPTSAETIEFLRAEQGERTNLAYSNWLASRYYQTAWFPLMFELRKALKTSTLIDQDPARNMLYRRGFGHGLVLGMHAARKEVGPHHTHRSALTKGLEATAVQLAIDSYPNGLEDVPQKINEEGEHVYKPTFVDPGYTEQLRIYSSVGFASSPEYADYADEFATFLISEADLRESATVGVGVALSALAYTRSRAAMSSDDPESDSPNAPTE